MSKAIFQRKGRVIDIAHFTEDGGMVIEMLEDCDPIIDQAKALSDAASPKNDGMRLEAFVPDFVMRRAFLEGWFHDNEAWRRWANDPANRPFRIEYNGRVHTL